MTARETLIARQDMLAAEDLPSLAAWVMVGNALLNLDETITRE